MRSFARFPVLAIAVIAAAAAFGAAAGPALAFPAARKSPSPTSARQSPATSMNDIFSSVAASSASNAWAVGGYDDARLTLTEHWNGTRWRLVPSPSPDGTAGRGHLFGVAVRPSQAWAVGRYSDGTANQTLAEHWNGTAWKVVPTVSPGGAANASQLERVAYYSRSRAWAVGSYANGGTSQALIERWNGSAWKGIPSPPVTGSALAGIAADSPSNAWAVGYYATGVAQSQTLIEHWNGIKWSTVPSPDPGTGLHVLTSVTAVSASDAWAVGYYTSSSQIQTLILHWNGSSWQQVSSPDVGGAANYNVLNGVTAASSSNAWADGYYSHNSAFQTLLLHWDGHSWKHVTSPDVGPSSDYLSGLAMTAKSPPWAVGDYIAPSGDLTLTERWSGTKWQVVPSPNK